jgi:hypothetical protein
LCLLNDEILAVVKVSNGSNENVPLTTVDLLLIDLGHVRLHCIRVAQLQGKQRNKFDSPLNLLMVSVILLMVNVHGLVTEPTAGLPRGLVVAGVGGRRVVARRRGPDPVVSAHLSTANRFDVAFHS